MSVGQDPPHITLPRLDSLVLSAILQDDTGAPIAIDAGELTVRGGVETGPVLYSVAADLSQAAQGIATFSIPPNTLTTPGRCPAAVVLSQGAALRQTGVLVIDVLDHA